MIIEKDATGKIMYDAIESELFVLDSVGDWRSYNIPVGIYMKIISEKTIIEGLKKHLWASGKYLPSGGYSREVLLSYESKGKNGYFEAIFCTGSSYGPRLVSTGATEYEALENLSKKIQRKEKQKIKEIEKMLKNVKKKGDNDE